MSGFLALLLVLLAGNCSSAMAASGVVVSGSQLLYNDDGSDANDLTISYNSGTDKFIVDDAGTALFASGGCTSVDADTASCDAAGVTDLTLTTGALGASLVIDPSVPAGITSFIQTGDQADTITSDAATENVLAGGGNDVINVGDGPTGQFIVAGSGNDTVDGGDAEDTVVAGPGDDVIDTGANIDNVQSGTGNDTIHLGSGNDSADGEEGDDQIFGEGDDDSIMGDDGDDTLDGGDGDDSFYPEQGDDVITGGPGGDNISNSSSSDGSDIMTGNSGFDSVNYVGRTAPLTILLDGSNNSGEAGEHDTIASDFEVAIGGLGSDTIVATSDDNFVAGALGDDTIYGLGGNDYIDGGFFTDLFDDGDDTLVGGAGNDQLYGYNNRDQLDGGTGSDDLHGGAGQDSATYADRNTGVDISLDDVANDGDPAAGEADNVHSDIETAAGGNGNDALVGNDESNTLRGGGGDDRLEGRAASDTLDGGAGTNSFAAIDGYQDTIICHDGDLLAIDPADLLQGCSASSGSTPPADACASLAGASSVSSTSAVQRFGRSRYVLTGPRKGYLLASDTTAARFQVRRVPGSGRAKLHSVSFTLDGQRLSSSRRSPFTARIVPSQFDTGVHMLRARIQPASGPAKTARLDVLVSRCELPSLDHQGPRKRKSYGNLSVTASGGGAQLQRVTFVLPAALRLKLPGGASPTSIGSLRVQSQSGSSTTYDVAASAGSIALNPSTGPVAAISHPTGGATIAISGLSNAKSLTFSLRGRSGKRLGVSGGCRSLVYSAKLEDTTGKSASLSARDSCRR